MTTPMYFKCYMAISEIQGLSTHSLDMLQLFLARTQAPHAFYHMGPITGPPNRLRS